MRIRIDDLILYDGRGGRMDKTAARYYVGPCGG